MGVSQNFQKYRVQVWKCYRTHRSSRYCGTGVQNSQKFRAGTKKTLPVLRFLWHGRTDLSEIPDTGMNVVGNSQKVGVRV